MRFFPNKSKPKEEKTLQVGRGSPGQSNGPETGSALIEFIGLGAMLMIPTVYFLLSIFAMQSRAFAASHASAHALQVIQQLPESHRTQAVAQNIAELAAGDYGLDGHRVTATLLCETTCGPADRISVQVSVEVPLPLIPWSKAPSMATMTSEAIRWGSDYS
ncbi:hypothetical protein [Rothia nasimurium]|uniref:hypothetical protein n=1 Tax=Rothia nasimurium TaxID=85336 RepID=UPI003BA2119E